MNPEKTRDHIQKKSSDSKKTYVGTHTSTLGVEEHVGIADERRRLHILVTGPTGFGKTQLLVHTALQDLSKGHGLCIVIPKGDAIDQILAKLPEERHDDVLYINPAGPGAPAINVLEPYVTPEMTNAHRENQKEIIVSDLIALFKRQSENWGDQFGRILETLLRAHLDLTIFDGERNSLLDVFRCVIDEDALSALIDRTEDPVIREQLVRVQEDTTSYQLEPLQRRLNDFVMNATIRNIIAADRCEIDFREAIDEQKIILVDVQKGEVGDTVAELLGSIVITKVWAAVQSRITQRPEERVPFFLYVDELQNFASEGTAFATLLSEAREYRLGCWLATQYLSNLASNTMREALINNCRSKIVFTPLGSQSETRLIDQLNGVNRQQVRSLGKYRAALQTPAERNQPRAIIFDTYPPWDGDDEQADELKQRRAVAGGTPSLQMDQNLGQPASSGGQHHAGLLAKAKEQLEQRGGVQVKRLYQEAGESKPDGIVSLPDNSEAYLEVEHTTLSKPAKVLKNLQRAVEDGKDCIFVVEAGNRSALERILSDPVNRRGREYEDEAGAYSYYQGDDGPFVNTDVVNDMAYRIIELEGVDQDREGEAEQADCPELESFSQEELETFCLQREDGYCTVLDQQCVFQVDD